MTRLSFDLVSPERLLYSEDVDMVVVPGTEGDFGVMAGHAPFMSVVRPGLLEVHGAEGAGAPLRIFISGGFADVTQGGLTVLAEEAYPLDDVKGEVFERLIAKASHEAENAGGDIEAARARARIDDLRSVRSQLGV